MSFYMHDKYTNVNYSTRMIASKIQYLKSSLKYKGSNMKNLLLLMALGSTTLLPAASISHTNADQEVRQKRDNLHQRTPSQEQRRQPQRQIHPREMNQRDTHRVDTKKTMRMQEQPQRTKTYQEQRRQAPKQIHPRDTQRVETKKTMRMQEQPQRTKVYQEQKRQPQRQVNPREMNQRQMIQRDTKRQPSKSSFRTQAQERQRVKHVHQRDSVQRTFRTHEEFNRARPRLKANYSNIYHKRDYQRHHNVRQPGLTYFINNWYFIYQDRHAPFYDSFGYFYGFFNEYGYYFEGIFYSYDRYYTYEDRLRGRGLFDDRYYAPYLEDGYDDWYDMYDDPYYN